ncbi:MAG: peptidase U32 family protein [Eubacteriales bacterium]
MRSEKREVRSEIKKPELLAPAGDPEKLKVAVIYGADAVYLGGRHFSLRAGAGNFSEKDMAEGIVFAHERGARVYVALNIFARNDDIGSLPEFVESVVRSGADGVIATDPGVISMVLSLYPNLKVHLSTQANTTNWTAARFWQEQGVSRIVLARELSLPEIKTIRMRVKAELEVFVHGAMCISYSGRCLLSNYLAFGRDANRGDCAQSCRWRYALVEEKRPGQYLPLEEDERGAYILSSRDLCLIGQIDALAGAGVDSFKIEGRMKSVHYLATVVRAYREAINFLYANPDGYMVDPAWLAEIGKVSNRKYTTGFFFGNPGEAGLHYGGEIYHRRYTFVGLVLDYDRKNGLAHVEQRNHFAEGDEVEVITPAGKPFSQKITAIYGEDMTRLKAAPHPQQKVLVPLDHVVLPYAMLRKAL